MIKKPDESEAIVRELLGSEERPEPPSSQLTAFLAGELDDPELARAAAAYLEDNPRLADRLRSALRWTAQLESDPHDAELAPALITITAPPLKAAAKDSHEGPPELHERRLLGEAAGVRLVYWREGGGGRVGIFRTTASNANDFTVAIDDGEPPLVDASSDEARVYDLGPARSLGGHELTLTKSGSEVLGRWLFVGEREA